MKRVVVVLHVKNDAPQAARGFLVLFVEVLVLRGSAFAACHSFAPGPPTREDAHLDPGDSDEEEYERGKMRSQGQ